MVFSALVDADFLCTEAFMSPDRTEQRHEWLMMSSKEWRQFWFDITRTSSALARRTRS
jgi:hypothetical protein